MFLQNMGFWRHCPGGGGGGPQNMEILGKTVNIDVPPHRNLGGDVSPLSPRGLAYGIVIGLSLCLSGLCLAVSLWSLLVDVFVMPSTLFFYCIKML